MESLTRPSISSEVPPPEHFRHLIWKQEIARLSKDYVEVSLTPLEVKTAVEHGTILWEHNLKMGRTNRFNGLPSKEAHITGAMGQAAAAKWLKWMMVPFEADPNLPVDNVRNLRHDLFIWDHTGVKHLVGVKTSLTPHIGEALTKGFLYPEAVSNKRVLEYPEWVIRGAWPKGYVQRTVYLTGNVDLETILKAPLRTVHNKPAHAMKESQVRSIAEFVGEVYWRGVGAA